MCTDPCVEFLLGGPRIGRLVLQHSGGFEDTQTRLNDRLATKLDGGEWSWGSLPVGPLVDNLGFSGADGTRMDAPWAARQSNSAISLREFRSYGVAVAIKEKSSTYERWKDIPSGARSGAA